MRHPDHYDPAPAGKVRRGRAIFQFGFEHGVWAARDGDVVSEDHHWRRGWVFPAGVVSLAAGNHWHELGSAIRLASANTASFARSDTSTLADTHRAGGPADIYGPDDGVAATVACGDASSIADPCGARGPTNIDGSDAGLAAAVKEIAGRSGRH